MGRDIPIGHVVWHDLLTNDVEAAKRFYAGLLDWTYEIEHAAEFAWASGEFDYPLILAGGEAHGGFVNPGVGTSSEWLSYVTVDDVDRVAAKAGNLGAGIEKEPFDVPGVGRSAVIRDPEGALICPYVPSHDYPPPAGTFVWNELVTDDTAAAEAFYGKLFGWKAEDRDAGPMGRHTVFKTADGTEAAGAVKRPFGETGSAAQWITCLAADEIETAVAKALALGGTLGMKTDAGQSAVLTDPTGALFGLIALD